MSNSRSSIENVNPPSESRPQLYVGESSAATGGLLITWVLGREPYSYTRDGKTQCVVSLLDPERPINTITIYLDGDVTPFEGIPPRTLITLLLDEVRFGKKGLTGEVSREAVISAFHAARES